ncbi:hypothetical protein PPTG_19252 [Phytophthora nicotianae INRA-310]|uniref:WRKY19-like zinc finger domain-containing protein n=1 Tax=Phytophthora nicotianae (strain INRA-310) TaxID=761204 RepID=W2PF45_PHYN3|nr:hypothetical protein PPTG_19252 [Phytophthora nicotianae INRA-310]ETM98813.1 hypothetical protein PPTG_19252 [Phytophthora nicotianae INRA-310]
MDEVAFVESLFAPEMRSAVASSSLFPSSMPLPSCGRVKALTAERALVPTPPSSGNFVPPPPNSLLGGGIALTQIQAPFQPPSEDTPLFARLHEDDMFGQMLNDQDFPDLNSFKKEAEAGGNKPPSSTNSLLLEPLDLPRNGGDQGLKDVFYNCQQYRSPPSSGARRSGICATNVSTSNTGYTLDSNMPVFPLGNQPYFGSYAGFPPLSPATHAWMQDTSTTNIQRGQSMKNMVVMASMGMSSPMVQHQPSPGSVDMFYPVATNSQQPPSPGLWISTLRNNQSETSQPEERKALDAFKTSVERPPFSLTISPTRRGMANTGLKAGMAIALALLLCCSVLRLEDVRIPHPGLWISTLRNNQSETSQPEERKALDAFKTSVERPPFSLTISPPASLTNKALKELIVSADFATPPMMSRPKRVRTDSGSQPRAKAARTTSASPVGQENSSTKANVKITKGKKCIEAGCTRRAQSNSRCKAHGGGARCQYSGPGGCNRSSQGGGFCRAHGGGKRCEFPGCTRGQQRKGRCYVHGGIRKCQFGNCEKKDRGNGFCISHGGGKRCEHPGCSRAVRRGLLCQIHETAEKEQGQSFAL